MTLRGQSVELNELWLSPAGNCYHLKALDHLDQIPLRFHYLTNFKCGYQTHILGRVAFPPFAPRIWRARATSLGLGEAVSSGQRKVTLVDPTLCHTLCWEKCDPRRLVTKVGLHRIWCLVWLPRSGLTPYDKHGLLMLKNEGPWLCELDWIVFKVFSMEG